MCQEIGTEVGCARGRNCRCSPDRASIHAGRIDCNTERGEIETRAPLSGLPTRASSLSFPVTDFVTPDERHHNGLLRTGVPAAGSVSRERLPPHCQCSPQPILDGTAPIGGVIQPQSVQASFSALGSVCLELMEVSTFPWFNELSWMLKLVEQSRQLGPAVDVRVCGSLLRPKTHFKTDLLRTSTSSVLEH